MKKLYVVLFVIVFLFSSALASDNDETYLQEALQKINTLSADRLELLVAELRIAEVKSHAETTTKYLSYVLYMDLSKFSSEQLDTLTLAVKAAQDSLVMPDIAAGDIAKFSAFYEFLQDTVIASDVSFESEITNNDDGTKHIRYTYLPVEGADVSVIYGKDGTVLSYQLGMDLSKQYASKKSGELMLAFGCCFCDISIDEANLVLEYLLATLASDQNDTYSTLLMSTCTRYGYKHKLTKVPIISYVLYTLSTE